MRRIDGTAHSFQLSRLPKAPTALRSLNFKGKTPGQIAPLRNRSLDPGGYKPTDASLAIKLNNLVKNKSLRFKPWSFPHAYTSGFTLQAYPKKLLSKPQHGPCIGRPKAGISLRFIISKKVHKFAVVRSRIRHRIKEALNLIATRGADGSLIGKNLTFAENDIGAKKWILQDWSYLVIPSLAVYRMPLRDLIHDLRTALKQVNDRARSWESSLLRHASLMATLPARADPVGSSRILKDPPAPPRMLDHTKAVRYAISLGSTSDTTHTLPKAYSREKRPRVHGGSDERKEPPLMKWDAIPTIRPVLPPASEDLTGSLPRAHAAESALSLESSSPQGSRITSPSGTTFLKNLFAKTNTQRPVIDLTLGNPTPDSATSKLFKSGIVLMPRPPETKLK